MTRRSWPWRRAALALLPAVLFGCRGFDPPSAATLAAIRGPGLAAGLAAGPFALELDAGGFAGVFDAVLARPQGAGFRLQLFPDVGGKLLDLRVDERAIEATGPGLDYRAEAPFAAAEPHLALVLAAVFAELLEPVAPGRVLGERAGPAGGCELRLRPALGSGEVVATMARDGAVASYRIALGWLEVELLADGSFEARGVRGRVWP